MKKLCWILTHILRMTPHSIATELNLPSQVIYDWIEDNASTDHGTYLRVRLLIATRLRFMPTETHYQRVWKDLVTEHVEKLLTARAIPSHHTRYENITAKSHTSSR